MVAIGSTAVGLSLYDGQVRVRKAERSDAAAIAVVYVRSCQAVYRGLVPQSYLDGLSPAQKQPGMERLLIETCWPRKGFLVAEVDHRPVGFVQLVPARDKDQDPTAVAEIASIYLAPEAWGRGVGRALMAAAVDTLTQASYREATLWVLDTNTRARRFYEATGWRADDAVKQDSSRGFTLTEIRYRRSTPGHRKPVPVACPTDR